MSKAAKAYAEFRGQNEETSLDYFLAKRGVYSECNFDDLSSMWEFDDGSVIRDTEDNFIIRDGAQ